MFTLINVLGLATGLATCLLIALYVRNELTYDRFNAHASRIARIVFKGKVQGGDLKEATVMPPVATTMVSEFPEIESATRIRSYGLPPVVIGEKIFREDRLAFVDANFFKIFTLPLLAGDAASALKQPNSVVISETLAKKYFGTANALGQTVTFKDQNASARVTGVMKDIPSNSHFHFDLFASMASLPEASAPSWTTSNFYTYVLLRKGTSISKLEPKLASLVDKYIGPQLQQAMGLTLSQFRKQGNNLTFGLQPLTDIHLHSDLTGEMEPSGNINNVYIFSVVGLFMLLIACINFMNLSTAAASKRAREVGVRKVMGSLRRQLLLQFLTESILLVLVSLALAIALVLLAMPVFNSFAGEDLMAQVKDNVVFWVELFVFGIIIGVIAGIYPALFLSSFNPVSVLKSRFSTGGNKNLRSALVVFQFFISITLMVGTAVVYKQLYYVNHKDLGYNKEQVLVIQNAWLLGNKASAFKEKISQYPGVASITASSYLPAGVSNSNNFFISGRDNNAGMVKALRYDVDENYLSTLGMTLASGRNFSKDFPTDSGGAVINETTARIIGWKDPVGQEFVHRENNGTEETYHVIGVVKDFHFKSLHELITPLVMTYAPDNAVLSLKMVPGQANRTIVEIQNAWNAMKPEGAMAFSFMDDRYRAIYKTDMTVARILGIFAGLTILVACLGLFGLATFTAEQRTKEIGVRKVLGASVGSIVSMLSRDFLKLVGIAFLLAAPVAWLVMNRWLQDFAYRINIAWWLFGAAAVIACAITLFTVSFQSIKAALANPVKSLSQLS